MKRTQFFILLAALTIFFTSCSTSSTQQEQNAAAGTNSENVIEICLSDSEITVEGEPAGTNKESAVFVANDIIYYESGKDFTYGEGSEEDAHSAEEAAAHTVLHITQPGTYSISGKLSKGQIAIDLGEDAENDPAAKVTLILNGLDITCEVAPAIIFYNVYECGSTDEDKASFDIDTSAAGANIIIADNSLNTVKGSYVARIYKPDSVVLNESKTEVEDAKKLHKYDGAFYSRMSMNIAGGEQNNGILNIIAENEGLDSELHLTINGGKINIESGNDGINTNEDGISVTTINGGELTINVTGNTGEGDGIDSNGWLVINGGQVTAAACSDSADAGIDSDMGIYINGGTVIASGHMLDRIEDGGQTYAVFSFTQKQAGGNMLSLKDENGSIVSEMMPDNSYSILIFSSPELTEGIYTLWNNDKQLAAGSENMMGRPNMKPDMQPDMRPDNSKWDKLPDNMQPPTESFEPKELPDGATPPFRQDMPEGERPADMPDLPDDRQGFPANKNTGEADEQTTDFRITDGANMFSGIIQAE